MWAQIPEQRLVIEPTKMASKYKLQSKSNNRLDQVSGGWEGYDTIFIASCRLGDTAKIRVLEFDKMVGYCNLKSLPSCKTLKPHLDEYGESG